MYLEPDHLHVSEHAAFATTLNQASLQQSVLNAFQLRRIDSRLVTTLLVRTLDGLDRAIRQGNILQAIAQLLIFRTEVQLATGRSIRDTGFAQLLLLNVDQLIAQLSGGLLSGGSFSLAQTSPDSGGRHGLAAWDDFPALGDPSWLKRNLATLFD